MQSAVLVPQCALSPILGAEVKDEQWHCSAMQPSQHVAQQVHHNTPDIIHPSVGVVYDAVMELHLRPEHLEHPNRVRELNRKLQEDGLLDRCRKLAPKLASDEELLMCHSRQHIDRVEQLYEKPIDTDGNSAEKEGDTYIISGDIFCNKYTSTAARSAAGCAVQAVRAVLKGEVKSAFAVVRPPGHHAESNELMGFCFYNNVAVAAHVALQDPGVQRVVIVDWDIHHGNGTQEIFYKDERVLFVSIHRRDPGFYPEGCGFAAEVGTDQGAGYTVNVPWDSKGMGDADYLAAYDLILEPIIKQFDPQLVLISAGFDAADGDVLGRCHVTPAGFAALTHRLQQHAGGKVVAVLEGGYVPWLIGDCASAVMKVLLGQTPPALVDKKSLKLHKTTQKVLTAVHEIQREYWSQLAALPPVEVRYAEYAAALKLQSLSLARTPSPSMTSLSAAAAARNTRAALRAAAAVQAAAVAQAAAAAAAATPKAAEGSAEVTLAAASEAEDLSSLVSRVSLSEASESSQAQPLVAASQPKAKPPKAVGKGRRGAAATAGAAIPAAPVVTSPDALAVQTDAVEAAAAAVAAAAVSASSQIQVTSVTAAPEAEQPSAVVDNLSRSQIEEGRLQTGAAGLLGAAGGPVAASTAQAPAPTAAAPAVADAAATTAQALAPTAAAAEDAAARKAVKIKIKKVGKQETEAAETQPPPVAAAAAPVVSGPADEAAAVNGAEGAGTGNTRRIKIKKVPNTKPAATTTDIICEPQKTAAAAATQGTVVASGTAPAAPTSLSQPAMTGVEVIETLPPPALFSSAEAQWQLDVSSSPMHIADNTSVQMPESACEAFYSTPTSLVPVASSGLSPDAAVPARTAAIATLPVASVGMVSAAHSGASVQGQCSTAGVCMPSGQANKIHSIATPVSAHRAAMGPQGSTAGVFALSSNPCGSGQSYSASSAADCELFQPVTAVPGNLAPGDTGTAALQQPASPAAADVETAVVQGSAIAGKTEDQPMVAASAANDPASAGDAAGSPNNKGPTFGQWLLRLVRSSPPKDAAQQQQVNQEVLEAANLALPDD